MVEIVIQWNPPTVSYSVISLNIYVRIREKLCYH